MASFIVISASNRLHYIVDGIEKCRPQNSSGTTHVSTGKIIKSDSGYVYKYLIHGKDSSGDDAKSLKDLLANQLAAFRNVHTIPANEIVNIFFLENPLDPQGFDESNEWLENIKDLHDKGLATNFCLFRLVFTYNLDNPTDVAEQIEVPVLKKLLEDHRAAIENNVATAYQRYIFYIDNQKSDQAAMCLDKEEHDLKLPRFLMDFMMLVSDLTTRGYVTDAINKSNCYCFSAGFAESMYYYPDVERYFVHADNRDLHFAFLTGEDDMAGNNGKEAMDVEKHPFGLRERKKRLEEIYGDVPFSEDIRNHPNSADKKIDDCIVRLKDCIEAEREKLKNAESQFDEEHPEYIDRTAIFQHILVASDPDKVAETEGRQYENLVSHVKSAKFLDFAKTEDAKTPTKPLPPTENNDGKQTHKGFFSRFLTRLRLRSKKKKEAVPAAVPDPVVNQHDLTESIMKIAELIRLKNAFSSFKEQVDSIEREHKKEEKYCNDFELTRHTNHHFPLIDLAKMKEEQSSTSKDRRDKVIEEWKKQESPIKTSLVALVKDRTTEYTKKEFLYINWDFPFSFVQELNVDDTLSTVCNELQKRSAPFVNLKPELATSNVKRIVRMIYSDRPEFVQEFNTMRNHLDNGNEISAYQSTHIASKICFMQFLPIDKDIMDALVDLQEGKDEKGRMATENSPTYEF